MSKRRICILGGVLSGPTAAARAREIDDDAEIMLIQRGPDIAFSFAGVAFRLSGEVKDEAALQREDRGYFEKYYRVDVRTETEALGIDVNKRTVHLRSVTDGGRMSIGYDALIFALGAASVAPDFLRDAGDGAELKNVRSLRTLEDLRAVVASGAQRFVVVGGGSFGVEAVDGLVRSGAEVTLLERSATLLPRFSDAVSAVAKNALTAKFAGAAPGTLPCVVKTAATVVRARVVDGAVTALELADGSVIETDFVISAAGVVPRTEMLAKAGIALAPDGSVVVDARAETSVKGVFACGSCVSVPQAITGAPVWWPQAAIADKYAQAAGANAAGGSFQVSPALGSMLVRCLDVTVGRTGLSLDEANLLLGADDVDTSLVETATHDPCYPHGARIVVELLSQRSTGRVLGVEAAGPVGVDKRIDAAAAAIAGKLTVDDLASLDFGYQVPFAAVRDPLNVVATVAKAERDGLGKSIPPAELAATRAAVQLVDVRSEERTEPALDGAVRIPFPVLRSRLAELDKKKPTVVVSNTGKRGWLAVRVLKQRGFTDVANLAGGLVAWRREGRGQ